jgi:hypothetical protein
MNDLKPGDLLIYDSENKKLVFLYIFILKETNKQFKFLRIWHTGSWDVVFGNKSADQYYDKIISPPKSYRIIIKQAFKLKSKSGKLKIK